MLLAIREYLVQRRRVSLQDVAIRFDTDPDAMRGMLDKWVGKGQLVKCDAAGCSGCASSCPSAREEAYEWVGAGR